MDGVALILVLLVLSSLAILGAPFVVSMMLHDRASRAFAGATAARLGAESARNHAIAQLESTAYAVEWERRRQELETEARPRLLGRSDDSRRDSSPRTKTDRGTLAGAGRDRSSGDRSRPAVVQSLPEALRVSAAGPSPAEHDPPEDSKPRALSTLDLPPEAPEDPTARDAPRRVDFQDPRGVTASVEVSDEQGKINLNSAPPHLIAAVFGTSQLARPLAPKDSVVYLDDATVFRGDAEAESVDGAVVVVHPASRDAEAIVYRRRSDTELLDCSRGDFLSLVSEQTFPVGSFVYDLRGWKLGFHRFWSRAHGGFHGGTLTELRSIEAMREIAEWQAAALFVSLLRAEEISIEDLEAAGARTGALERAGLDPSLFAEGAQKTDIRRENAYKDAVKALRRARFSTGLLKRIEEQRGPQVIVDLAARVEGAKRDEVEKIEADFEKALAAEKGRRRRTRAGGKYLAQALERLIDLYKIPGIETVLAEDVERHRDAFTVHSTLPALWSEPQALLSALSLAGPDYKVAVPRPGEFNPGTVVRLRRHGESEAEFNLVRACAGAIEGEVELAFPPRSSAAEHGATISALGRHPVNANTASRRVLRAVFTGVRGADGDEVVTPYEADRLAALVESRRPLRGHEDFYKLLDSASKSDVIESGDVLPLLVNAVQPTHISLRQSTTGLCYASRDVYTIESRGILRAASGKEIVQARFREIVDVSTAGRLRVGLAMQEDVADGFFRTDAYASVSYPEGRHQFLVGFPGTRSHLVLSRPLLLHHAPYSFPGGDRTNLRLLTAETPDSGAYQLGRVLHFRETAEGLELSKGEPYSVEIGLGGSNGAGGIGAGAGAGLGAAAAGATDLTMVPGGIEFWMRLRSYPSSRSKEGYLKLLEAGADPERNYIVLYYDPAEARFLFRIRDSSLPDPLLPQDRDSGPFLQVEARRPLDLDTWYHLRLVWDGVYGGGAQLYVDGLPAGRDNLSTELSGAIPADTPVSSISVRDASKFPREGVVRVGSELFEYSARSDTTLTVRQQPASHWKPLPVSGVPAEEGGASGGSLGPAGAAAVPALTRSDMRSPWNRRGASAAAHAPGEKVVLHGYSLEVRRKVRIPAGQQGQGGSLEFQVPDGDAQYMVWGPGGLAAKEPLPAFNWPQEVRNVVHYVDLRLLEIPAAGGEGGGRPGGGRSGRGGSGEDGGTARTSGPIIVPLFRLALTDAGAAGQPGGPGAPGAPGGLGAVALFAAKLPSGQRDASDYFQTRGVVNVAGTSFLYQKVPLQPDFSEYVEAQLADPFVAKPPQMIGLKILSRYPPGPGEVEGLSGLGGGERGARAAEVPTIGIWMVLNQLSILATGIVAERYPITGIIEVRGQPTPWERQLGRPDVLNQPLFQVHPDDAVEWLRYGEVYEDMFVGRLRPFGTSNFRGYPERDLSLKKQLDIPAGQPLRLVMELGQGGAGFGDYVTIASGDPAVYEPAPKRVYRVLENVDGRFFASLVDVNPAGAELARSLGASRHVYFRAMNPRLVKFPSWGLPEVGTGSLTLFGDAKFLRPSGGGTLLGGGNGGSAARAPEHSVLATVRDEEEFQGIYLDEVRRLHNTTVFHNPTFGPRVRYVFVPLESGKVSVQGEGSGHAAISGVLPQNRTVLPSRPQEALVVAVSWERGAPSMFARGLEEGLVRIGDELFYFEDPQGSGEAQQGGGAPVGGIAVLGSAEGGTYAPPLGGEDAPGAQSEIRDPQDRGLVLQSFPARSFSGQWEQEGFALLRDDNPVRANFFEVMYYGRLGGGFSNCLRGQFHTPILGEISLGTAFNVTRRIVLKGRALLGTQPQSHGVGEPVELLPYLTVRPLAGAMTDTGLPVKKAQVFGAQPGYVLADHGVPGQPWEILAHLGARGEDLLLRPRTEQGQACLRARFGTLERPVSADVFAYAMPFRYFDRYEAEVESESLAYLQKSFRVPGAHWRAVEWSVRADKLNRERLSDVVVAVRFDGSPDWSAPATNRRGGLWVLEDKGRRRGREAPRFELGESADEAEVRVYFRFRPGAFQRVQGDVFRDDWKESPVLDSLILEYEKDGAVLRHEELPF
jgi:hypothetical protein